METLSYKAVRCEDCDYIEDGKKVFYATIETENDVVDYISFESEIEVYDFIEKYNKEELSKRTAQDIYLEYVNDWLTIDAMAEHYGIEPQQLGLLLASVKYAQ